MGAALATGDAQRSAGFGAGGLAGGRSGVPRRGSRLAQPTGVAIAALIGGVATVVGLMIASFAR
jgi:hypothetical protein